MHKKQKNGKLTELVMPASCKRKPFENGVD
jgi:hypothetical protein